MGQLPGIAVFTLAVASCSGADPLTVRTVSEYGGTPIAGVNVQAGDQAWTLTDEAGEAVFEPIDGPFTVMAHQIMVAPSGSRFEDVFVLPEQTGSEAVVQVDGSAVPERQAEITGTLTGRSAPDTQIQIAFSGDDQELFGGGPAEGDAFAATARWERGASRTVTVHALESDAADPPASYFTYGATEVEVTDGGSLTGVVVELSPLDQARVAGNATVPAELASLPVQWAAWFEYSHLSITSSLETGPLDMMVPLVPGDDLRVSVYARDPAVWFGPSSQHSRVVSPPDTAVAFDLPAPVVLVGPDEGAVLDASTQFRWISGPPNGEHRLQVICDIMTDELRAVNYRAFPVTGEVATLPEIPSLVLDPGMTCVWEIGWHEHVEDSWRAAYTGQRSLVVP